MLSTSGVCLRQEAGTDPTRACRSLLFSWRMLSEHIAGTLSKINPPIVCPIKTGNYTFDNAEFDLNIVSKLPMDGW